MKLKIKISSKTDGGAGYIRLWIDDNKRWCSIVIYEDNSIKLYDHSDIIK